MIELTFSLALTLLVAATVIVLFDPAEKAFVMSPEMSDMQQRLRVATNTLYTDLVMAGGGGQAGGLHTFFAPVLPYRRGAIRDAAAGSFTTDTITVLYVPPTAPQTTTSVPVFAARAALRVNGGSGCPRTPDGAASPLCGFSSGMSVLIFDDAGRFDVFTVESVDGDVAQLSAHKPAAAATMVYPAGSNVVEIVDRTYALHVDVAKKLFQLVSSDGTDRGDVPVVDNVVSLKFEYFGDPQPPALDKPLDDPVGPWTSYGPRPPPADVRSTEYPVGENCLFARDSQGNAVPRLAMIGGGGNPQALVQLTEQQLTDGPWCPDAVGSDGFDADLLRIRAIAITLRVQSALEALRGPAGILFVNGGTARDGRRWLPDLEVRFMVTPRNLNLAR